MLFFLPFINHGYRSSQLACITDCLPVYLYQLINEIKMELNWNNAKVWQEKANEKKEIYFVAVYESETLI